MIKKSLSIFIALILGTGLIFSCVGKQTDSGFPVAELKDPALVHGVLDNGFQYLLMKNTTPKDRVSVHLDVFTGSVREMDKEQGIAHFLEHMLFNGSENFKPGELITYFQSIGMDFGADANARTSFYNTIYDLSLPKGDDKHLKEAFVVIKDYAGGALLLQSEIDRERGVVLAEKRERDSVSFRTFKKELAFELPGSILPRRLPIGLEDVIRSVDQKMMKGFYDRWYRPDNMALVIVGDIDIRQTENLIKEGFSSLKARSNKGFTDPDISWSPHEGTKVFVHREPEAGSTHVTIERLSYRKFKPETINDLKDKTSQYIGDLIFQNRLSRMVREQTADFSSASVYSGTYLRNLTISAVQAYCDPENWEVVIGQLDYTLRQALTFGFSANELDRVKADAVLSLDAAVAKASTRKSPAIAQELLSTLNRKGLFLSPVQKRDLLVPHIRALSLDEVNGVFRESWPDDHRLVMVTGNLEVGNDPEKRVARVFETSRDRVPKPYAQAAAKPFPYLKLPEFSAPVIREADNVKGLGIRQIDLANNIRINMKPTDFQKGEFAFKAVFGLGKAGMHPRMNGLSSLAESTVGQSGFGAMDLDELDTALAGKDVNIGFKINETSFSIEGSASPEDTELVFQLLYTYFKDPGFRPKSLELAKVLYRQQYDALRRTPDGVMQILGNRFLAGGDSRFGLEDPEQSLDLSITQIESWLRPEFESSPLEISFVGDFNSKSLEQFTQKYFGAMEKRQAPVRGGVTEEKISFPRGESKTYYLDTRLDKAVARVAFCTDDFWNIMQTRQLSLLSRVLSERLRKTIRETLGASYSPYVYNNPSLNFKGYGVMNLVVNLSPETLDSIAPKITDLISELVEMGVTSEELALVKGPLMNHLTVLIQTNSYWLNSVMANSFRHPERIDWALNLMDGYQGITPEDLDRLAKKYLLVGDRAVIKVVPKNLN